MLDILDYLKKAVEIQASDVFIISGLPVSFKIDGAILPQEDSPIMPEAANSLIRKIYEMSERSMDSFIESGDDDFSISVKGLSRFRVSTYRQRGSMAAVIRVIKFEIPDPKELNIPDEVIRISEKNKGLVLVAGSAGSGKSTTLSCIIDAINSTRNSHIITLEDPIEFLHRNKKSVISQREIRTDTESYITALKACLRQAPDVILLGEMRDFETIRTAMTAAETGHLVISTLHTMGAANTIDRVIDVFPQNQQQQIRVQLAMVLQTVVSQQLVPAIDGGMIPAFEIMHLNNAIRNMIRESKIHQIDGVIAASSRDGMISMDTYLLDLYNEKKITVETAINYSFNVEQMERRIKGE